MVLEKFLPDEAATLALGEALGQRLSANSSAQVVFLEGDLGAGKTTLCRGVLRAFGHSGPVKSPTYTLVEDYQLGERFVHHFDLYRLGDPEELEYMGIRDYFIEGHICVLEWPERGEGVLPMPDLRVKVVVEGSGRQASIAAHSSVGDAILRGWN